MPKKKAKTTWERFAEKKGIGKGKRGEAGGRVWDEERGEWRAKWGYGREGKGGEGEWIVEVEEGGKEGGGRGEGRRERKENRKRGERRMRNNERRSGQGGG